MRIRILKDLENFTAGTELSFVTWRNEKDRSVSGKLTEEDDFIHFDTGTFRRLGVFESCYTVDVSNLGLHHELNDRIQCDLCVSNDSNHSYWPEDESYDWSKELNLYLEDAGVPLTGEIILSFSW